MVEIVEVKDWTTLKASFRVEVKSLEDLKKIADGLREPYIYRKKKEYLLFRGMGIGGTPICYYYKE